MSGLFKAVASRLQNLTTNKPPVTTANFEEIVEGSARILHPKGSVFYNPAQVVNRDLSVLVIRHHGRQRNKSLRILEALSATGLRSIRYFKEIPNVSQIIANDLDPTAVANIRRTVSLNGLNEETEVIPNQGDAAAVMALAAGQGHIFDVVDLDPYGSAAPFIEPAIRSVAHGGLLCVTCTDLPVLCGNAPEICHARYGSTPVKSPTTHEVAVRIVYSSIQATANRLGRAIEPILCAKIDFYVRLFVRVVDSKSLAQHTPSKSSLIFQCVECGSQQFQPLGKVREVLSTSASKRKLRRREQDADCSTGDANGIDGEAKLDPDKSFPEKREVNYKFAVPNVLTGISSECPTCSGNMCMGGPIWTGPLIGDGVAESLLEDLASGDGNFKMRDRIEALIRLLREEVSGVPLFLHLPSMCKTLNVTMPPTASVRAALQAKGYKVSLSHVDPSSLKTTAPTALVWDILRIWARKVGSSHLKNLEMADDTCGKVSTDRRRCAGERILAKEPSLISADDIDFGIKKDKFTRRGDGTKQVRFPHNPERNWGPKARAGKRLRPTDEEIKD